MTLLSSHKTQTGALLEPSPSLPENRWRWGNDPESLLSSLLSGELLLPEPVTLRLVLFPTRLLNSLLLAFRSTTPSEPTDSRIKLAAREKTRWMLFNKTSCGLLSPVKTLQIDLPVF